MQHHHAHVAARLVEHGREEAVIGVSMDGLGYGDDGRLWGGEVLVCDLTGYRRVAHLEELPLPGGAAADHAAVADGPRLELRAPRARGAASAPSRCSRPRRAAAQTASPRRRTRRSRRWSRQIDRGVNAPLTTSCGRLFDAVAALAGVRHRITYEGQAAIELEMMASGPAVGTAAGPYEWTLDGDAGAAAMAARLGAAGWVARPRGRERGRSVRRPRSSASRRSFAGVLDDLEAGAAPGVVGARLHATVADVVLDLCRRVRAAGGPAAVALAGGVFQNRLLADLCERAARGRRLRGARRRPRPRQRRRRLAGAGRRRGLYSARAPRGARLTAARPRRTQTRPQDSAHVPRPSHAHHRPRRRARHDRRRGPGAGVQRHARPGRRRGRLRAGARRFRHQRDRRGGGAGDLRPPARDRLVRRGRRAGRG